MRVLIVVTKGEIGGAQRSVLLLAQALVKRGVAVTVGAGRGDFLALELAKSNIPCVHFSWLRRTVNPFVSLGFIFEFKDFLDQHQFEVVHLNSTNALCGAIGAKLSHSRPKVVFTFRGLSFLDPHHRGRPFVKFIHWLFFKMFLIFVDQPVFVSERNFQDARAMRLVQTGQVIMNGIDHERFISPSDGGFSPSARGGVGGGGREGVGGSIIVGSVGRLAYPKNYEFLIRQLPALIEYNQELRLVLVGDGPERSRYERLVTELSLWESVVFMGALPDAYQYFKTFDIFVLPSIFEGASITLLEAMAAGLSILASDVGGNAELLGEAGLVYELDNKKEFQEKMHRLISDEKLRMDLSRRALLRAQDFTIEKTADNYLNLYRKLSPP